MIVVEDGSKFHDELKEVSDNYLKTLKTNPGERKLPVEYDFSFYERYVKSSSLGDELYSRFFLEPPKAFDELGHLNETYFEKLTPLEKAKRSESCVLDIIKRKKTELNIKLRGRITKIVDEL